MNKIVYIRTGGQTDVDQVALDFARKWIAKNQNR